MMQKSSLNIIVFDEDQQSFPDQSFLGKKSSLGNSMGFDIVTKEMESIFQKLKDLQRKTQKLNKQISSRTTQNRTSQQSHTSSHYENILLTIETKIQLILKKTQAMMKKITSNFQRKLKEKAQQQKNTNNDQVIIKMQNQLRRVETQYANQLSKIQNKKQQLQQQTYQRLNDIEEQYARRVIQFQRKQRDYADKIEQLESKIRNLTNKNKKAMQVTQDKNNLKQQDYYERTTKNHNIVLPKSIANNQYQTGELDKRSTILANDTSNSRIRRRKIFEKNQNRSVSPNERPTNKVVSPLHHDNNFTNKNISSKNVQSRTMIPQNIKSTQNIKQRKQSNQKKIVFQATPTASDFYRDIPKANWQKFECFDKDDSSQQDVFFYPQHQQFKKQPNQASELDNFLSPLDLN